MKKLILLAVLMSLSSFAYSQSNASATSDVNISLIRGLTLNTYGANTLNFGEIVVTASSQTESISNENGQIFHATGHPWREVHVNYSEEVVLNNEAWVTTNGGTPSTITFVTNIASGTLEPVFENNPVPSGTVGMFMPNEFGIGEGYLWIGGEIEILANHPAGEYVGELQVSIAY